MKASKRKFSLKLILFIGAILFVANLYVITYGYPGMVLFSEYQLLFRNVLLVSTLITSFLFFRNETIGRFRLALVISSLFVLISLSHSGEILAFEHHKQQMELIHQINTCEKAETAFLSDLESNDLKYFLYGMGVDERDYKYLRNEYELDVYGMGCIVHNSLICYNELVEDYIQTTKHQEFWSFNK